MRRFGSRVADALDGRGYPLPRSLVVDLGMVGQSREMFLARTAAGALLGRCCRTRSWSRGHSSGLIGLAVPLWLVLLGALVRAWCPTRSSAGTPR